MAVPAPLASDEGRRLERLLSLGVLDSEAEPLFDALTRAASLLTGAPIALMTLVDDRRQWFKSNIGLEGTAETSRDIAFCSYTILGDEPFVVRDAMKDPRFSDNPLVTDAPHIRFYAGAPITLGDGLRMGALCVIDRRPRELSEQQASILRELARAAAEALEQRKAALERSESLHREALLHRLQMDDRKRLAAILDASQAGTWEWNIQTGEMRFNEQWARILGYKLEDLDLLSSSVWRHLRADEGGIVQGAQRRLTHPDDLPLLDERLQEHLRGERPLFESEARLRHQDGHWLWGLLRGRVISHTDDGAPLWIYGTLVDVSERKRAVEYVQRSEHRFRKLFEESLGLICTHDLDGTILSANPAAAQSLGYSMGELLGRPFKDLIEPTLHPMFDAYLQRVTTTGVAQGLLRIQSKSGNTLTWQYHNSLDTEGEDPYVLGHALDVTERMRHESQLREWSVRDSLTGLYNRRYLGQVAENLVRGEPWGCIVIDLERFKSVNDTYGHQRGDQVLVAMGQFLTTHVRPDDIVVRSGGDEFVVLLPGAGEQDTLAIMQRLDSARASAPIGFTMGHAIRFGDAPLDAALAQADNQLYRVRRDRGYQGR
ncbi:PAS domain S-box protein [Dyella sp. C11]|uniref:sensor domain-containing diguanylate cyclase n=1 Tax=Dyella sp. C11 TaxID=2126991 RepID=UPI000D6591ED|nr:PAS domain S-box protein [Dyella sp. C11]